MDSAYLHYSQVPIPKLYDIDEQPTHFKPRGLWLSRGSAWLEWGDENGFGVSENYVYKVELRTEPNLLELNSYEDLVELNKKYASWQDVSRDYNGVLVANYGEVRKRVLFKYDWCAKPAGIGYLWYLGLDVPCACIWRPSKAVASLVLEELPR